MLATWLYSFSDLTILLLFVVAVGVGLYLFTHLLRGIPALRDREDFDDEWLIAVKSGLVALGAVVLGFSLVLVLTNFDRVEAQVAKEASKLEDFDRLARLYGGQSAQALQSAVLSYGKSIIKDEWPKLAQGGSSEKTEQAFEPVLQAVSQLNPSDFRQAALYADLIKELDQLTDARAERVGGAHVGLHPIFWSVNTLIFFGVLVTSSLGMVRGNIIRTIALYLQALALAGVMSIVFIVDQPFKGQTAVSPEPLAAAVQAIETRLKSRASPVQ